MLAPSHVEKHSSLPYPDELAAELARAPSTRTVERVIAALDARRIALSPAEWRALAARVRVHPLAKLLAFDPYTRRAREKPRGYAGDAVMLDYVYDGTTEPLADVGRAVFTSTTGSGAGAAVRERRADLARAIDETCATFAAPTVIALACGHARERELARAVVERRVGRVVCVDQDRASLATVAARFRGQPVDICPASVKQIVAGEGELPRAALVTCAGLFDYLSDATAAALLARLVDATVPGGRIVVANFAPDIVKRGYMESIMDWWLTYRSAGELAALVGRVALPVAQAWTRTDSTGRIVTLEIVR